MLENESVNDEISSAVSEAMPLSEIQIIVTLSSCLRCHRYPVGIDVGKLVGGHVCACLVYMCCMHTLGCIDVSNPNKSYMTKVKKHCKFEDLLGCILGGLVAITASTYTVDVW